MIIGKLFNCSFLWCYCSGVTNISLKRPRKSGGRYYKKYMYIAENRLSTMKHQLFCKPLYNPLGALLYNSRHLLAKWYKILFQRFITCGTVHPYIGTTPLKGTLPVKKFVVSQTLSSNGKYICGYFFFYVIYLPSFIYKIKVLSRVKKMFKKAHSCPSFSKNCTSGP